ncbi:hypothetical protein [Deinococcus koreensis]|uniref:Uncharacterized protein n=1 Tax=Deinococcus koreensis TaxID=2054903 RepID=A0A2K3V113_9DEIO|nr:hypothetical protein [Deinococcus koreensis]PNY82469.1 hypothetical protein CVO96_14925 [Deinococcus koreensis]
MTPDEWRLAMEHEAVTVQDAVWGRETRNMARDWDRPLADTGIALGVALALAAFWLVGLVAVSRVAWKMDQNVLGAWMNVHPARFDLLFLGTLGLAGLLLGWHGLRPGRVAAVLACLPLVLWLLSLGVRSEGVWSEAGESFQAFSTDFAVYQLSWASLTFAGGTAMAGFLSTWAGRRASQAWLRGKSKPSTTLPSSGHR